MLNNQIVELSGQEFYICAKTTFFKAHMLYDHNVLDDGAMIILNHKLVLEASYIFFLAVKQDILLQPQ